MANHETKTQTTKNKREDADPPARFASYNPKDSKANSERGKSPTETTTKEICQGHSGKKSTVSQLSKRISYHPIK